MMLRAVSVFVRVSDQETAGKVDLLFAFRLGMVLRN